MSGHPLERHRGLLRYFDVTEAARLPEILQGAGGFGVEVTLAGLVTGVRLLRDRKGNPMAFASVEDFSGTAECLLYSELHEA